MAEKLENIQILFQKRNARKRGPTSSDQFNDLLDEIAHDLTEINNRINNSLVPLTATLDDGTLGISGNQIDAFTNGLDGSTMFVLSSASSSTDTQFWNISAERPNTIKEQFDDIYSELEDIRESILVATGIGTDITASEVSIEDLSGHFASTNVEDALSEIATAINLAGDNFKVDGQIYQSTVPISSPSGTTQTIDWDNGDSQILNLESASGNVLVDFINARPGATLVLEVRQETTAHDITVSGVTWPDGVAPMATVSGIDVFTFWNNGSNIRGIGSSQNHL